MSEVLRKIKLALLFIPVLLAGWVYFLIQQTRSLKSQVARQNAEKDMAAVIKRLQEAKKDADQKESEYRAARNAFLNDPESDDGGDGNLFS